MFDISDNSVRLNNTNYTRPNTTITDSLQNPQAYKEKLKGYSEVKYIDSTRLNTHVRYFIYIIKEDKWKFRTGGLLKKISDKYVILSNGKQRWSVQREVIDESTGDIWETKFFKILTKPELTEIALEKQQNEIEKLRTENRALKNQLYSLDN